MFFLVLANINNVYYENIIQFIKWLNTLYSEASTAKVMRADCQLWNDVFMMVQSLSFKTITINFTKPSMNSHRIHDEIFRITNMQKLLKYKNKNIIFQYQTYKLKNVKEYAGLKFELPKDGKTLVCWSVLLQNCLNSYAMSIQFEISTIYGVFRDDKLLYAVEINGDLILQALGIRNTKIPKNDMDIIDLWFQGYLQSFEQWCISANMNKINGIIEEKTRFLEAPRI
jgi:hypothetical protein